MRRLAWLLAMCGAMGSFGCSDSGTRSDGVSTDPGTAGNSGAGDGSADNLGTNPPGANGTSGSNPGEASDASTPGAGRADGAAPGLGDQVVEYLTCKPDELNPIVDCVTVACPMKADPLALATCLLDDCAKLVEKVSPKCRDCVVAGIAQDTTGLLQNCLDTGSILGDAGSSNPLLPF